MNAEEMKFQIVDRVYIQDELMKTQLKILRKLSG